MKNIKEFINESAFDNMPITKSAKSIKYPPANRSYVCTGVILGQKEYDKLLAELG